MLGAQAAFYDQDRAGQARKFRPELDRFRILVQAADDPIGHPTLARNGKARSNHASVRAG